MSNKTYLYRDLEEAPSEHAHAIYRKKISAVKIKISMENVDIFDNGEAAQYMFWIKNKKIGIPLQTPILLSESESE